MMLLLLAVLIVLALAGVPIFALISMAALFGFYTEGVSLSVFAIDFSRIAEMPVLVAIPLFTFAGYLLGESKAPHRLVRLTQAFLSWMPGGLALVSLVVCAIFTAFTGASGVTIVALGAILFPALIQAGYPEKYTLGLITTSGCLGLLFAPSLPLIIYGVVAQQMDIGRSVSIEKLFIAGILPGVLMLVLLSVYSIWVNRKNLKVVVPFTRREKWEALRNAMWELPLPVVVLGGVYFGWFAVSEAAAITAFYTLIVEVVILREVSVKALPKVMRDSVLVVGAILIILGASIVLTTYTVEAGFPEALLSFLKRHVSSRWTFLLLLNVFLLILGCVLHIFEALVLIVPMLLPVAVNYGVDPVHFGIIFLANMQVGYLMPPVGLDLSYSSYRFNKPISQIFQATMPFLLILIGSVIIITYVPSLSLMFIK